MATKWCMQCGSEYVATVEECPDCAVALVDQAPDSSRLAADEDGEVAYDLAEWSIESRAMIEQLVGGEEIPHAWEGTTLVVPAVFESRVDALIEEVEVTTLPTLDPEAPKVAYNLDDWTDEQHTALHEAFAELGIAYEYDADGDLVVLEEDEEQVEAIIDKIDFGDAETGGSGMSEDGEVVEEGGEYLDDSLEAAEVLSDLFVAADKLMHSATDHEGVLGLVAAAGAAERMRPPYGFSAAVWGELVGQAVRLKALLEGDFEAIGDELDPGDESGSGRVDLSGEQTAAGPGTVEVDDEMIEAAARRLRETLRPYV